MRLLLVNIAVLISSVLYSQKKVAFVSLGINYRSYPIDIENVPRGPYSSNGLPDDEKFWKVLSFNSGAGTKLKKNWQISLSICTRYNHLTWLQGRNLATPPVEKRREKKNLKFDFFTQVEKQLQLKKRQKQCFFIAVGVGLINLNTKYKVFLQDTLPSGPTQGKMYEGTYLHFSPNLSIGYQYEKIRASIDAHIIEGPDQTNLTSLWIGGTICYEIILRRKKVESNRQNK